MQKIKETDEALGGNITQPWLVWPSLLQELFLCEYSWY